MPALRRPIAVSTLFFAVLAVAAARAELVRVEIASREPFAEGRALGDVGPCERLRGTAHFELDPELDANAMIVDLKLCPTNDAGRVEFSADVEFVLPVDRTKCNGSLFYEVNNRGGRTAPGNIDGGADHFLLRQGFVVGYSGWIGETHPGADRLLCMLPVPTVNGMPLRDPVRQEFIVDEPKERVAVTHRGGMGAYRPSANGETHATLTWRLHEADERVAIPRDQWKFHITDVQHGGEYLPLPMVEVEIARGAQPGYIYELIYEAEGSICQGAGLAGIRDLLSFLKHETSDKNPLRKAAGSPLIERVHGFGTSQSGRCLRHFLYDGFNADERGRKVFDGVMAHVAGGGLGSFNHRFAQPTRTNGQHEEHDFPADMFPFTYGDSIDPYGDASMPDGILKKARAAGVVPKVMHTQSSSEYWHRSGSLVHTDPFGREDAAIPDEVRIYTFGGARHSAGSGLPAPREKGQLPTNPADFRPLLRALVVALDEWVRDDREPPPSTYPKIADKTLVGWRDYASGWRPLPGVRYPDVIHQPGSYDRGPYWATQRRPTHHPPARRGLYAVLVPAYDEDDNDRGCLNLPTLSVPVATYTSWNLRDRAIGAEGELLGLMGGYVPFPKTAGERIATGDPRRALLERYESFDDYEARLRAAAEMSAGERYLLDEDVPRIMALGEKHRILFE